MESAWKKGDGAVVTCEDYYKLQDALGIRQGEEGELPDALLLPWPVEDSDDGGRTVVVLKVDALNAAIRKEGKKKELAQPPAPPLPAAATRPNKKRKTSNGTCSGWRDLTMIEACMGSGRLARSFAEAGGWAVEGVERNPRAIEYPNGWTLERHDGSPVMVRPGQGPLLPKVRLHIKVLRDIRPESLPTVDYIHFALQCTSVSKAAGAAHKRTAEDNFMGTSAACKEYNQDLNHAIQICRNQLARNEDFKFSFEAPEVKQP